MDRTSSLSSFKSCFDLFFDLWVLCVKFNCWCSLQLCYKSTSHSTLILLGYLILFQPTYVMRFILTIPTSISSAHITVLISGPYSQLLPEHFYLYQSDSSIQDTSNWTWPHITNLFPLLPFLLWGLKLPSTQLIKSKTCISSSTSSSLLFTLQISNLSLIPASCITYVASEIDHFFPLPSLPLPYSSGQSHLLTGLLQQQ